MIRDPVRYATAMRRAGAAPRNAGLMLAGAGAVLALVRAMWVPDLPRVVPAMLIVTALGLLAIGTIRRIRFHITHRRR